MVIWLAFGLQAAVTLGNRMGSRSWPKGLSGRSRRALCHSRQLWAEPRGWGLELPCPLASNSIYCLLLHVLQ